MGETFSDADDDALTLGRYTLDEAIGRGGFGIVYRGVDPLLRRTVAIKLLRSRRGSGSLGGPEALIHEARMAAQLQHPNVVRVFDVGRVDDSSFGADVFVVMELLHGQPMHRWMKDTGPEPKRIVAVMIQVAEGLAEAHQRGVIHCDIKPGNIFITEGADAKVVDFGLALHSSQRESKRKTVGGEDDRGGASELVAGTPRYMPPEAHAGSPLHPASDQYSFALVLAEALAGSHPFERGSPEELHRAKAGGVDEGWLRKHVPRGLIPVLRRATSPHPAHRYAGMSTLAAELRRWLQPSRALPVAIGGLVLALGAGAAWSASRPPARCALSPNAAARLWDSAKPGLRSSSRGADTSWSERGRSRFEADVDTFVAAWEMAASTACAGERDDTMPADDLAVTQCLRERLGRLEAVLSTVEAGDHTVLLHANGLVAQLIPPQECLDPATAFERPPTPRDPQARQRAEEIRDLLSSAHAQYLAGKYGEGLALAKLGLGDAVELGFAPVHAEAMHQIGLLLGAKGELEDGAAYIELAYLRAEGHRYDRLAATTAVRLVAVHGVHLRNDGLAREWARRSEAALERLPLDHSLHATLAYNLGLLEHYVGNDDDAGTHLARARALSHAQGARRELADAEFALGMIAFRRGNNQRALELFEGVYATRQETMGAEHPATSNTLSAIAITRTSLGELQRARTGYVEALAALERALGHSHHDVATVLSNLGTVELKLGRLDDAVEHFGRCLAILQNALPPDHPKIITALDNLATASLYTEDYEAAREGQARVLEARLAKLPPSHRRVTRARTSLGLALANLGRAQEAREQLDAAAENLANSDPAAAASDQFRIVQARTVLGERPVEDLRRLIDAFGSNASGAAAARFELAKLLREEDPARARALAEAALESFGVIGATARGDTVRAWLREYAD